MSEGRIYTRAEIGGVMLDHYDSGRMRTALGGNETGGDIDLVEFYSSGVD